MECEVFIKLTNRSASGAIGFGRGMVRLLEGVRELGSINASTHAMGMAYSKAWRILKATEAEFGVSLLARDGARGSVLTPEAEELIALYNKTLSSAQKAAAAELQRELKPK